MTQKEEIRGRVTVHTTELRVALLLISDTLALELELGKEPLSQVGVTSIYIFLSPCLEYVLTVFMCLQMGGRTGYTCVRHTLCVLNTFMWVSMLVLLACDEVKNEW